MTCDTSRSAPASTKRLWARLSAARAVGAALLLAGCAAPASDLLVGEAWPEADALFHSEPRWLGSDATYGVELGGGRVLWLFGDSFITTSSAHVRSQSVLVRNSVTLQTGADPAHTAMAFAWGQDAAGKPSAFFTAPVADTWL